MKLKLLHTTKIKDFYSKYITPRNAVLRWQPVTDNIKRAGFYIGDKLDSSFDSYNAGLKKL